MFFDQPTIDFNGFLMDFRFFRTMVNDGLATPKLQKVCKFNSWQNMFSQHRRENHCSNNNLTNNFSFLYRILTISIILAHLKILKRPLKISMVMKRPLNIFNGFGGHHYHSQFPRRGGKSKINWPELALMSKIVRKYPQSPQKISKSGNEGILSYGQFCHFSPILWLGGWGCPPRQSTPNFGLRSTKLVGTIQVSKKMTHTDNGGGPDWNYGENGGFAVFLHFA